MALMVNFCEKHRFAFPCADPWKPGEPCPRGKKIGGVKVDACPVKSADAFAVIDDLGREVEAAEESLDELVT